MGILASMKMAIKSIVSNRLRTFLTMLGVMIGVASVIVAVGFAKGSTSSITSSLEGTGTNVITISLMGRRTSTITYDDVKELLDSLEGIDGYAPLLTSNVYLKNADKESFSTSVLGTNADYDVVQDETVQEGRFLTTFDVDGSMNVAVVGTYVANSLYPEGNAVGQEIKISGKKFTIVGILTETASGEEGTADDKVLIPYTVMQRLMGTGNVNTIVMRSSNHEDTEAVVTRTERLLYGLYENEEYYRVTSQEEMLETLNDITNTLMIVLGGIAAISLVVGGIGIMNIMIVSVTERTREIGIRKAIGARRGNIMIQFLIESLFITGIAGLLGILLACVILHGIDASGLVPTVYSVEWMLIAFGTSLGIGILFGIFPAYKAASLDPIVALRTE